MCGIVGYIGSKSALDILLDGLTNLEYRGYDSAGIATIESDKITTIKSLGRVSDLEKAIQLFLKDGSEEASRNVEKCKALILSIEEENKKQQRNKKIAIISAISAVLLLVIVIFSCITSYNSRIAISSYSICY